MSSCTFQFWISPANKEVTHKCLIQAENKGHAFVLIEAKKHIRLRNLHALTKQCKQWNWPVGTLVIGKAEKELF